MRNTEKKQKNTKFSPNCISFLAGRGDMKDAGDMAAVTRATRPNASDGFLLSVNKVREYSRTDAAASFQQQRFLSSKRLQDGCPLSSRFSVLFLILQDRLEAGEGDGRGGLCHVTRVSPPSQGVLGSGETPWGGFSLSHL